jgi:hypothetical protein
VPQKPVITLQSAVHRQQPVVLMKFAYNDDLIDAVKKLGNTFWSASKHCWYIPKDKFVLGEFFTTMEPLAWIDYSAVKNKNVQQPKKHTKKKLQPCFNKKTVTIQSSKNTNFPGDFNSFV